MQSVIKLTEWFPRTEQPVFAGEYEAELSTGETKIVKYHASGWDLASASVVRWRGHNVRLTTAQRKTLKRAIHEGRHASSKHEAQEAALWLARSFVARAADPALVDDQVAQAKRNACGWYQIAHRLGVDMTSNLGLAGDADTRALSEFWQGLPAGAREGITRVADGFKDGSGDRPSFD